MTSRIDTINLLEKRVKSRFSGRIFRTGPPDDAQDWLGIAKSILLVPITHKKQEVAEQWNRSWTTSVNKFLSDSNAMKIFRETFDISRDVQVLQRLLVGNISPRCLDLLDLKFRHAAFFVWTPANQAWRIKSLLPQRSHNEHESAISTSIVSSYSCVSLPANIPQTYRTRWSVCLLQACMLTSLVIKHSLSKCYSRGSVISCGPQHQHQYNWMAATLVWWSAHERF